MLPIEELRNELRRLKHSGAWEDIAKESRCGYITLSRFFRGKQSPRADTYALICEAVERRINAPNAEA